MAPFPRVVDHLAHSVWFCRRRVEDRFTESLAGPRPRRKWPAGAMRGRRPPNGRDPARRRLRSHAAIAPAQRADRGASRAAQGRSGGDRGAALHGPGDCGGAGQPAREERRIGGRDKGGGIGLVSVPETAAPHGAGPPDQPHRITLPPAPCGHAGRRDRGSGDAAHPPPPRRVSPVLHLTRLERLRMLAVSRTGSLSGATANPPASSAETESSS